MTVIASIAAKNYLPRVRVLAESLRRHHPDLQLQVLLADELAGELDPAKESYRLVAMSELAMAGQRQFCFRYAIKQRAAALKPYFIQHLLDQGHDNVLFIDPDMVLTARLDPLLKPLQQQAIILTPHLLQPASGNMAIARELEMLQAGMFNGGVIGVSDEPQGRAFLTWWQQRVAYHALDSVAEGMYYDQRWLDFAPGLFDRLQVVCDAGCNVAHWNLIERPLAWRNGELYSGDTLCRLVHFSGYDPLLPLRLSGHADWTSADASPALFELLQSYRQQLLDAGHEQAQGWISAWGHFNNGQPIAPILRAIFNTVPWLTHFVDPFACSAGSFFAWLDEAADNQEPPLSNLWDRLPEVAPEVHQRWPQHRTTNRSAYLTWAHNEGWRLYGLKSPYEPAAAACNPSEEVTQYRQHTMLAAQHAAEAYEAMDKAQLTQKR